MLNLQKIFAKANKYCNNYIPITMVQDLLKDYGLKDTTHEIIDVEHGKQLVHIKSKVEKHLINIYYVSNVSLPQLNVKSILFNFSHFSNIPKLFDAARRISEGWSGSINGILNITQLSEMIPISYFHNIYGAADNPLAHIVYLENLYSQSYGSFRNPDYPDFRFLLYCRDYIRAASSFKTIDRIICQKVYWKTPYGNEIVIGNAQGGVKIPYSLGTTGFNRFTGDIPEPSSFIESQHDGKLFNSHAPRIYKMKHVGFCRINNNRTVDKLDEYEDDCWYMLYFITDYNYNYLIAYRDKKYYELRGRKNLIVDVTMDSLNNEDLKFINHVISKL